LLFVRPRKHHYLHWPLLSWHSVPASRPE